MRDLGLNAYRFSIEWARIEPVPWLISIAMLDHYKAQDSLVDLARHIYGS